MPGKNAKPLCGKPLVQYTIEAAMEVFQCKEICLTTDSEEIKSIGERLGLEVPFLRPSTLAGDQVGSQEVLFHAIEFYMRQLNYSPDVVVLLQPTSPFRKEEHIREALTMYDAASMDMLVSVKETRANPYYVLFEEDSDGYLQKSKQGNFARRQDCPKVWEYNGAIYIMDRVKFLAGGFSSLKRVKKYEMDEISSHDIDSPLDWMLAETMIRELSS